MLHTLRQPGDGRYDESRQSQTYAILFEGERPTNVQTAMSAINQPLRGLDPLQKWGSPVRKRPASIALPGRHTPVWAVRLTRERDDLPGGRSTFEPVWPNRRKLHQGRAVMVPYHQRTLAQCPLTAGEEISRTAALRCNGAFEGARCGVERHGAHAHPSSFRGVQWGRRHLAGWGGRGRRRIVLAAHAADRGKSVTGAPPERRKAGHHGTQAPRREPSANEFVRDTTATCHIRPWSE